MSTLHAWRSTLDMDFPHFKEVTRYIYGQLLIAAENKSSTPNFAPILLLGEPGIGKTTYVRHFAQHLGIPFAMQSLANVSAGFVLTGSDSTWRGGKPGWLAQTFMDMHTINPIFMLDEIDKSSSSVGGSNHNNVQETLLSLLEPETSSRFRDEYLTHLQMDLSQVFFVATANDLSSLSKPLLSRFQIMDVPAPSRVERRDIVQNIYRRMVSDMGLDRRFLPVMADDILDAMVNKTVSEGNLRDIRGVLRMTLGNAMIRSAHVADIADAQITLCQEDMSDPRDLRSPRSMGFISH